MKTSLYVLTALVFLVSGCAYRNLRQEIADHNISTLPLSQIKKTETGEIEEKAKPPFSMVKADLQAKKEHWQQLTSLAATGEHFFNPDQTRLLKIKTLSASPEKTAVGIATSFTLKDFELLVLLRDPAIRAAKARFLATLESYSQVTGLDEILRQYTAFTEGVMVGVGPMKGVEPVYFPFPGILSLKGEIANHNAKAAWETYQIAIRSRITLARETFWNLTFNDEAYQISKEMVRLYQRLETVAKTRYEAGLTSFQDVIRIRIKKETLLEEVRSRQEKRHTFAARLRELLNLPETAIIGAPMADNRSADIFNAESLIEIALDRRQELKRLAAKIAKMETMLELAETMILPPYSMNLSLFEDRAISQIGSGARRESFNLTVAAERGAGLPKKPWFGVGNAYLDQTRQKLTGLKQDLIHAINATRALVRGSWFELDRAVREEALYRDSIVNLSQAALNVVIRGYESGNISFADVIASHTTWLSANLSRARKKSDVGIAQAKMEAIIGASRQK